MTRRFCCLVLAAAGSAMAAEPMGVLPGDPLQRLGLAAADLGAPVHTAARFLGWSRYPNRCRAVVTHTIDDSTKYVAACLDAMDHYDIKATVFVSTQREPVSQLWPRLRQAIENGHEIGSHSRTHQCKWPDTAGFCDGAYSESEIAGSRDDILRNTPQPYVWSWCYPCGNCAAQAQIQRRLERAGYLVARNYPNEAEDGHVLPDLQTWDANPYNAGYTQVAQKKGGIAKSGRTDVAALNAKFDEVYEKGGIYNLMSHPQWLDLGPDQFYERHLAHIGRRADVWYAPMGPLYAYHTERQRTRVRPLRDGRFAVYNDLDPKIYDASLTLEFEAPPGARVFAGGKPLAEFAGLTDRWDRQYVRRDGAVLLVTVRPNTILEVR